MTAQARLPMHGPTERLEHSTLARDGPRRRAQGCDGARRYFEPEGTPVGQRGLWVHMASPTRAAAMASEFVCVARRRG